MDNQKHTYKLHYFDIRGRAEPIRLIFQYYGIKFDDNRLSEEEWVKVKEDAPMHQVPYLEVDEGKLRLCQTLAICRYLAKSLKPNDYFGGSTKSDAAKCDMYADTFMDFFTISVERIFESDPDIKAKKEEKFEKQYPARLKIFEDHLKRNGGDYFLLWCDLVAVAVLSMAEETKPELLQNFPDLQAYYSNICNLPEIKEYIAENWPSSTNEPSNANDEQVSANVDEGEPDLE
ncbi:hypothetical protein RB195_000109 [Necator americanus]